MVKTSLEFQKYKIVGKFWLYIYDTHTIQSRNKNNQLNQQPINYFVTV